MEINKVYSLNKEEQEIVYLISKMRQDNKVKTGWNGYGCLTDDGYKRNLIGFGAEFIFSREQNLFLDIVIKNTSKKQNTDNFDCMFHGMSVDVKAATRDREIMIPKYNKSNVDLFAFFVCENFPNYIFKGFATNNMIFNSLNIRKTKVLSYCYDQNDLLNENQIIFLKNMYK